MVKLFLVTDSRQAIHFECISVKLSVDSVASDHVYWWKLILFFIIKEIIKLLYSCGT